MRGGGGSSVVGGLVMPLASHGPRRYPLPPSPQKGISVNIEKPSGAIVTVIRHCASPDP